MNIDALIDQVIAVEGEYSNHPADRGGPTNWGITEQTARAFGYKGDMRDLPRTIAAQIYRARYWEQPRFNQVATLAPDVAAELFDIGVNMGVGWAVHFLQRALNVFNRGASDYPDIGIDGAIGPMTIDALRRYLARRGAQGEAVLVKAIDALRAERYIDIAEKNPSQEAFVYGWIANRVGKVAGA